MNWLEILREDAFDTEYFLDHALELMTNGRQGESYWITADGDPELIPMFGEHENLAYSMFGPKDADESEDDEDEIRRRYGYLFAGWTSQFITDNDVAMMHGWVRLMFAPQRNKTLYINIIQGAVSPVAKAVMRTLIKTIGDVVQTYVIEHSGQQTQQTNFTVNDGRKALALII